ncbi:guanine nucleotide-binding protein G(o) subunit alpha-like [Acanthaster planci]|uniref:Guanine nucleotide-binding protein G(O) subunit alpha-like n=1 Tax=Acanthaster planci TaxID=133434 RepID=A0A8B7ZBR2_ACAPL|nr:guanine nucleotide-binding protein G(o) subunit alpha-like [Acanthaster planci]XP_022102417.1 guanine nucleotide-binding protein G(o) subunit alpha-like [Acanthaster planci]
MGACIGVDQEEKRARLHSEAIDRQLIQMSKEEEHIVKILLLGAGESGKSTLVKQMKIIHSDGFTNHELMSFKPAVLDNLLSSMKYVLNGMGLLRIPLANPRNKIYAQTILQCHRCFDEQVKMRTSIAIALRALWNDTGIRACVARGHEFELNDSALYYFENMERITSEYYRPSTVDVLRARVRTTGVIETHFKIKGVIFRMYDVGGQRSERRKWIQCFDDVKALLYVTALSGYDMTLFEDPEVNRLRESLHLFESVCNNCFFRNTTIILFLNKVDLFRQKILHTERQLRLYFPEYPGPDYDVETACRFLRRRFQDANHNPKKHIYPHFTTATDTTNVEVVFQIVMETIIRENLKTAGML